MGTQTKLKGRFAPTPSGRMHLGNVFAALLAWLDIRSAGGELLLRMEDLDEERCRPEYAGQLADDLIWLGLTWDSGWRPGEEHYRQSRRGAHYEEALRTLGEQGLLYPCYCSRRERMAASAPHASDGSVLYRGRCRSLGERERAELERSGRKPALRIKAPHVSVSVQDGKYGTYTEFLDEACGDFILRRSDGVYAYQLAVAVDDAEMGVSRVVRGRDLLSSAPRQIWLLEQLGYQAPDYCHAPLLTDSMGRRLSKRDRDLDMASLRRRTTPEKLIGFLAFLAGLMEKPEAVSARELIPEFSWEKVSGGDKAVPERLPEEWMRQLC